MLLLYYVLHWLYFYGDRTKKFCHAIQRVLWKPVLWQLFHILTFMSLLTLAASASFLVNHLDLSATTALVEKRAEGVAEEAVRSLATVLWSRSVSLAITLISITGFTLLNRPLDLPKTLLVNRLMLRLAPRLPAVVVILCLPLIPNLGR